MKLVDLHIGQAIKNRLTALNMTQEEFAKRIGTQQGNIPRILKKDSIETKKLVEICLALNYNFFEAFCEKDEEDMVQAEPTPGWIMDKYAQLAVKNNELQKENAEMSQIIDDLETRLSKYELVKKEGA